jgi:hypothetical protein
MTSMEEARERRERVRAFEHRLYGSDVFIRWSDADIKRIAQHYGVYQFLLSSFLLPRSQDLKAEWLK